MRLHSEKARTLRPAGKCGPHPAACQGEPAWHPPCYLCLLPSLHRRAEGLNQFLEYATSKDNVFLVTVSQVLDWMKNPGEKEAGRGPIGWLAGAGLVDWCTALKLKWQLHKMFCIFTSPAPPLQ